MFTIIVVANAECFGQWYDVASLEVSGMCETVVHGESAYPEEGALQQAAYRPVERGTEGVGTDYHKSCD